MNLNGKTKMATTGNCGPIDTNQPRHYKIMKSPKKAIAVVASAILAATAPSCSKYDDGPKISLRTPTGRLTAHRWDVDKTQNPDFDSDTDYEFDFKKDRSASLKYRYEYSAFGVSRIYIYKYQGDWEWTDSKESLEIDLKDFGEPLEFQITRLTSKELNWKDKEGYEWELRAK